MRFNIHGFDTYSKIKPYTVDQNCKLFEKSYRDMVIA